MTGYLSDHVKVTTALDYANGATDRKGATLDMQNWDGVLMIVKLAAVEAAGVNSIKAQHSDTTTDGHFVDVAGTKITIADDDDNEVLYLDLYQPVKRYVRLYVDKDTVKECAETALYVQYCGRTGPSVQPAGVSGEQHLSPISGTA